MACLYDTAWHGPKGGVGQMVFPNESALDWTVRLIAGSAIVAIGWFGPVDTLLGVACRILGWYPLVTGILGWSPLYAVLGWSTKSGSRQP